MFRLEFQSHVTEEDDDNSSDSIAESVYQPVIFEGRVGHFGKMHRVSQSKPNGNCREAEFMDSGYSPVFEGVTQDETSQQAIFLDAQVLRELVRPFAALQHGSIINERAEDESSSSSSISGGFSMRSADGSSFRSDVSSPSEGSVADLKALQREGKPWGEPLLALQQQQNEVAAAETRRRDGEQTLEAITTQRELRDLANCVEYSPSHGSFKKNKPQKVLHCKTGVAAVCRFFKNPFGLFKSPKIHNGYPSQEGVPSPVTPRRVVGEYDDLSGSDAAVLQMQTASHRPARSAIEFATVNSTQRDVPAWTTEEYMRKNGKAHQWKRSKDDEEFGGIQGNNLMNQNFDAGRHATYDLDSD